MYDQKQKARFAGVALSEATRLVAESDPASANASRVTQSQLLNRLLLEDTYPEFIEKSDCPLRVALAEDLTTDHEGPFPLSRRSASPGLALSDETKQLLAQGAQGANPVRLNRCLLEDAFPSELLKNRVGRARQRQPLVCHDLPFRRPALGGRGVLFAAALRIHGGHRAQGPGSLLHGDVLAALLPGQAGRGPALRRAAGPFLSRTPGLRHSGTLWLIIGLSTMIAPVGLFVFQRFIRVHEAGRDD